MTIQVGDYIIMKRGAPYGITQYGSTGIVRDIGGTEVWVEFDHMTGDNSHTESAYFWVSVSHCKRTKQLTQQERICAKVKLMEKRWLKFQAKRGNCHV